MRHIKLLGLLILAGAVVGCQHVSYEVESGEYLELPIDWDDDIVDAYVESRPSNGKLEVDINNNSVAYRSNAGFYGQDHASMKFATQSCFMRWCWLNWSSPIELTINVGPGEAGLKDVLNPEKVSKVGTILSEAIISDPQVADVMRREFNFATVENALKWGALVDANGNYDFSIADELVNWANENGLEVKGHTLVWYNQVPEFINAEISAEDLTQEIIDHVEVVLNHYDSSCPNGNEGLCIKIWDVINEPSASPSLVEDASPIDGRYRDNIFYKKLGGEYMSLALHAARKHAPDAQLIINDYNIEGATIKSDNFYSIVKELLDNGAPVDGVGFQSHVVFDHSPIELLNNLKRFSDLGLSVNISEIDVPASNLEVVVANLAKKVLAGQSIGFFDLVDVPSIGRTEEDQNIYWANYAAACAIIEKCQWVTQWGIHDASSWIGQSDAKPLTFDNDLQRKNTYFSLASGLTGNAILREPSERSNSLWEAPFDFVIDLITSTNL